MQQTNSIGPVALDWETEGIEGRPSYPPKPVGVAVKFPHKEAQYYAWGHLTDNTCTGLNSPMGTSPTHSNVLYEVMEHAKQYGVVMHNAKFDLDILETYFGFSLPWDKIHDTLFLLYLDNPHRVNLGLKACAEELLGLPPEEQDEVGQWLMDNQPVFGVKIVATKSSDHFFGKYLSKAPGSLVGKYARGDVIRTEKLFELLYPKILNLGMGGAYDRERKLLSVLLGAERDGIALDRDRLSEDFEKCKKAYSSATSWIQKRLSAPDVNVNSEDSLISALKSAGLLDVAKLSYTDKGGISTTKAALKLCVLDQEVVEVLAYMAELATCLNTFMENWLKISGVDGRLYTNWHQTRSISGRGTRTGRLSSSPNFQNMPKQFDEYFKDGAPFEDFCQLPVLRSYIIPFPGHVFIDRDYSQQEPRILAYFEEGALYAQYLEDPTLDVHNHVQTILAAQGKHYPRKAVKMINLGIIYGKGIALLAKEIDDTPVVAKQLKEAILQLYPGIRGMYNDMRRLASLGLPAITWGGRRIHCEPSKIIKDKLVSFDYKMVNAVIQGSAADCTKEALIRYAEIKHPEAKIVLNVHDQITVSVPKELQDSEMAKLKSAMESIEFDIPMLTDGAISETNWAELRSYHDL